MELNESDLNMLNRIVDFLGLNHFSNLSKHLSKELKMIIRKIKREDPPKIQLEYFVVNHEKKTIQKYNSEKRAKRFCRLQLKFSKSLCVFYYSELQFNQLDLDLSKFEIVDNSIIY